MSTTRLVFQRMIEHEITTQGILYALDHLFSTMPNTSLLEDKHAPLLGQDVKVSVFTPRNAGCATLHAVIPEVDLQSHSCLTAIWEL